MPRHVAFLRAINIGGRRASSAQLTAALDGVGFTNVTAFRASGNLIFDADRVSHASLTKRVDEALTESLGFEVRSFLRTASQVRAIAAAQPFPEKVVVASAGKFQVFILGQAPPTKARKQILAMSTDDDRVAISGRELYWLPSGPTMRTELNLREIDALVGENTRRTKSMIAEIAAKFLDA